MDSAKVEGFPRYTIFKDGTIRDDQENKPVKVLDKGKNIGKVRLYSEENKPYYRQHILLYATAFLPKPKNRRTAKSIMALDGNIKNLSLDNLRWYNGVIETPKQQRGVPRYASIYAYDLQTHTIVEYQNRIACISRLKVTGTNIADAIDRFPRIVNKRYILSGSKEALEKLDVVELLDKHNWIVVKMDDTLYPPMIPTDVGKLLGLAYSAVGMRTNSHPFLFNGKRTNLYSVCRAAHLGLIPNLPSKYAAKYMSPAVAATPTPAPIITPPTPLIETPQEAVVTNPPAAEKVNILISSDMVLTVNMTNLRNVLVEKTNNGIVIHYDQKE